MSNPPTETTLFSTTQSFQKRGLLPPDVIHPFASSAEESCATLHDLINTTDVLANSLNAYSSISFSNPKLVSLLRQHSSIAYTFYQSDRNTRQIVDALRKQPRLSYGEDIPLDPMAIVEWCVSCLETWGTSVGMETFKDDGRGGGISLVFGGKVLVIDIDFAVDRTEPSNGGSIALDTFLRDTVERFCSEVQQPAEVRNLQETARLGVTISEQLQYLVMLDKLAARKEGGGLKWFGGVDELCPLLENFTKREAEGMASSPSDPRIPLDIFLLRSHTIPVPYLLSPSVSFLVHISPLSYLTLLSANPTLKPPQNESQTAKLDISTSLLRQYLRSQPKGVALATLSLSTVSAAHIFPVSMSMPNFTSRPTFSLVPQGSEPEYVFPQVADLTSAMASYESDGNGAQYTWYLDFTNGGRNPGVVLSQSRMRDIELIVNPLVGIDTFNSVEMLSFGTESWVNLLLNPEGNVSRERYTTLYVSPKSIHPPLHLRLSVPEEPGFRLERVPVHNMKEVWGTLEVVREQCWLNEILATCEWKAEGESNSSDMLEGKEATEEELEAVLAGNITPIKIPVNVFLPSSLAAFSDLDAMSITQMNHRGPRIVMTSPERPPISGLVEITVSYDETRPRGVSVNVAGAMGADIKPEMLEEISRRGGTLGLSGRVWAKAHGTL